MKTIHPKRRSVSPFGLTSPVEVDPLAAFEELWREKFPLENRSEVRVLKSVDDLTLVPDFVKKSWDAPGNDPAVLENLCQYLLKHRLHVEDRGLADSLFSTMETIFNQKTELFLVDHHTKDHCEKMGWAVEYRDVVLFSKERDLLMGRYFSPLTEKEPGRFSELVTRWAQTTNPDRILHFLDFAAGSRNPTFEYYLLFAHPAFNRLLSNKSLVRELFEKAAPVLKKLSSPTWEKDVRKALLG